MVIDARARRWGWSAVLVVVPVFWGYNWVVMKKALAYCGPFQFAAWRFVLGAGVLFAAMALMRRPFRAPAGGAVIVGLLQTGANTGFTMWALLGGPAGRSALLSYAMPFWVLLLGWPVLGERPTRLKTVATGVALTGIALIVGASWAGHRLAAAVMAILAGVTWAAGTVLARRVLTRTRCDTLAFTAWQMLAGGIGLALCALVAPTRATDWSSPTFLALLAYEVFPATAVAWLLWVALLGKVEAAVASLAILGGPLIGLLSSAAELGERPSVPEAVGMALMLAALVMVGPLALRQVRR